MCCKRNGSSEYYLDICSYTRESKGRGLRSIIDYFIVRCKVTRIAELESDHYLVLLNEGEPEAKEAREETDVTTLYKTKFYHKHLSRLCNKGCHQQISGYQALVLLPHN